MLSASVLDLRAGVLKEKRHEPNSHLSFYRIGFGASPGRAHDPAFGHGQLPGAAVTGRYSPLLNVRRF